MILQDYTNIEQPLDIPSPFPAEVAFCALSSSDSSLGDLYEAAPEVDRRYIDKASSKKRRTEFLLGRQAARRCLQQLNFPGNPELRKGEQGEPLWPDGFSGSITHSGSLVLACATKREDYKAIALDIEDRGKIRSLNIAKQICRKEELSWIDSIDGDKDKQTALISLFSAKETIYKAYFPICGRFFGFQSVTLRMNADNTRFVGELMEELQPDYLPIGKTVSVGLRTNPGYILTSLLE